LGALIGAVLTAFAIDMVHRADAAPVQPVIVQQYHGEPTVNVSLSINDLELDITSPDFDIVTLSQADMHCLAHAIYYEARGERYVGMLAVANVIMNRVSDPDYPKSVCEVTRQRTRTTCQFEYYCKVGNRIPRHDDPQWQMANDLAFQVMSGNVPDLTDGATRFHAISGSAGHTRNAIRIGSHLFYRK
jgi:spore germination cell wall hydrolase CwlJ-like protein